MAKLFDLVLALFLLALLQPAVAILKCYDCSRCNDPFNNHDITITDCDGVCYKAKASSDKDSLGVKTGDVKRGCQHLKVKPKCEEAEKYGIKGEVCWCDSDLCNGSDFTKVTMTTVANGSDFTKATTTATKATTTTTACDSDLCNGSDVTKATITTNGSDVTKATITTGIMAAMAILKVITL